MIVDVLQLVDYEDFKSLEVTILSLKGCKVRFSLGQWWELAWYKWASSGNESPVNLIS